MYFRGLDAQPPLAKCLECGLKECTFVAGAGPKHTPLVIVGDVPGTEDVSQGEPFVGRYGRLLDEVLELAGLHREHIYITNSVLCRPNPHRQPKASEIKACNDRLLAEVKERTPKVVLAFGGAALKALTGLSSIKKERGKPIKVDELGATVIPTYHPAVVLRSPNLYIDLQRDVQFAAMLLNQKEIKELPEPEILLVTMDTPLGLLIESLHGTIALDVETDSTGEVLCFSISRSPERAVVFDVDVCKDMRSKPSLTYEAFFEALGRCHLIGHNLKYDVQALYRSFGYMLPIGGDTMLAHYTLDERQGVHSLENCLNESFGLGDYSQDVAPYMKCMEVAPRELLYEYNGKDSAYTRALWDDLKERQDDHDRWVEENLLIPAANTLARMESTGVLIDREGLEEAQRRLTKEIMQAEKELHRVAGQEFNPRSPQQLVHLLYNELELPVPGRLSTDEEALEAIKDFHPLPQMILDYRRLVKLNSTYLESMWKASARTGRIHTTFNLHGTQTGRLSSSNPINLQNIPKRNPDHEALVRSLFVASPGYTLIEADLSQAELRVLACFCGDPKLIAAIEGGTDLHREMAAQIYDKAPEDVTREERNNAKTINFAVLYGAGAGKVAGTLNITVDEAKQLIDRWFETFERVQTHYIDKVEAQLFKEGVVTTPLGRKRRFPYITNENQWDFKRQAVNFPIQSVASDLTLSALIRLGKAIDWENTRLLLTVHDSILLETREDPMEIAKLVHEFMTTPVFDFCKAVPFAADVAIGQNWAEMEEVEWGIVSEAL